MFSNKRRRGGKVNMFVIYGLQDPRDNAVFYVGMTADIYKRFITHLKCEDNNEEKNKRIHELKAQGLVPILVTFEVVHTQELASKRESYWIQHYVHLGAPLTNVQLVKVRKQIKPASQHRSAIDERHKPSSMLSKTNERLVREVLTQCPDAGPREVQKRTGLAVSTAWRCLKRIRETEKLA